MAMRVVCGGVLALLATGVPIEAATFDVPVVGQRFAVKDPTAGIDPSRRSLIVTAGLNNVLQVEQVQSSLPGATITFFVDGATPASQTFSMPGGTDPVTHESFWQYRNAGGSGWKWTYKDLAGTNGPVRTLKYAVGVTGAVSTFFFKAQIVGKHGAIDLVPPDPATGGCALLTVSVFGDTFNVHMRFAPGIVRKNDSRAFITTGGAGGFCP